jgi:hypothetical protein
LELLGAAVLNISNRIDRLLVLLFRKILKAVGLYKYLSIEHPQWLVDLDIHPTTNHPITGHDLLVYIKAQSV